ncbi:MAG: metallophosphoesterase, partial [Gammaproteobacteria bacterium]|nr:metallophosphoesterase [Gammaproteobacteria bacterium]
MIRLIQITDTHIYAEAGDCFEGVDTRASFERVIKHLHRFNPAYDGLLLTGDLAMDGSREAYGYLRHMLAEEVPVLCLPGNHDEPRFLAESGLSTAAPAPLCYVIAEWHLILLDTQVDDCAHGEINAAQIDWLNRSLGAADDDYAAVFLHHHPASIGSP